MNLSNSSISNSEVVEFLKLAKRLAVFSIPFLIGALFVLLADPFNYFRVSSLVAEDVKAPITKKLNPGFSQLSAFDRDPKPNILLGDSRMQELEPITLKEVTGDDYANLAYGGGSLREAFDSFWIASKKIRLRKVYLGIALMTYNDYEIANRTELYKSVNENPALYFINRTVWESAIYSVYSELSGEKIRLGTPKMSKDEFWQVELGILQKFYEKYTEPVKYRRELGEIADFCRQNNIELNFVIFPMHTDAQKQIVDLGLAKPNQAMRSELSKLGKVYDFEKVNESTSDKNNFNDPVHLNEISQKQLIVDIWGKREARTTIP